jgi:hypothetical protein
MKAALSLRAAPWPSTTATRFLPLVTLALLGAPSAGCSKGTYLEVVFQGTGLPAVRQLNVTLTNNTDSTYVSGLLPDFDAASTELVKFPSSVAFQLNDLPDHTPLTVAVDALSPANTLVARAQAPTTVMHAKTWTVTLDLNPSAQGGLDAGAGDASDDARSLFRITDGSVTEGSVGCVAATVEASESVSVDYISSGGSNVDAGNMLWANLGPQERILGWMKFGLKAIPNNAGGFRITKATLNLSLSELPAGSLPQLQIRSSTSDGWTRKSSADAIAVGDKMSEVSVTPPLALPAVNSYPLDVTSHDWAADVVDGTVTLGVENVTALAGTITSSKVEFYGVAAPLATDVTRPTLDLEFCR